MKKPKLHTGQFLLFLVVVLFSLTPCKVKSSWFESFGATYEQTLNQSKVTSNCNIISISTAKLLAAKSVRLINPSVYSLKNTFYFEKTAVLPKLSTAAITVQFPPKYILYKRFKFDLA